MSQLLTTLIAQVRADYLDLMETGGGRYPYTTAEKLCNDQLYLEADALAQFVAEDPTLLAARRGVLVVSESEQENPSVGMIISANIAAAMMEGLIDIALESGWLSLGDDGRLQLDAEELALPELAVTDVDYSHSQTARDNLVRPGNSLLTEVMNRAESAYLERLKGAQQNPYMLALEVASEYSLFAPDDIAPLVEENPLLLGLRGDGMVDEALFEGDPPAGMIISAHLTQMVVSQLLEVAVEQGVLGTDSSGHPLLPGNDSDEPVIH
ncbi:hypothetical protein EH243_06760 [Amphritea opalescens]|uniref:Uncharacterized protein n=1 Tax=Amphritea opalescens TaxID=2490544 RepID=A0A430KS16_9GAMM|nr:hypothetical protein [Amphritea opalescens]RTE66292.1 hypothetical protein EH243_06760 [Amphritea opalescens]